MSVSKRFKSVVKHYGQLVIGPPGAGKTTYSKNMSELLKKLGRHVVVINLDPANDTMSYEPDIDIMNLISVEDVMDKHNLGPNGALLYCMEYLEQNIDWLINQVHRDTSTNFVFDLPGQVELYCHHASLGNIFNKLTNEANMQLCVVHLVDSHHCSDAGKFIAALMLSLNAMLKIGLPHINLLTKTDLLKKHVDKLQFGIDFYTDVLDLNYLLDSLETDRFTSKYQKLNSAFVSIIEDYSLVTFQLVNMFSEESLIKVNNLVDKTNGYVFKSEEGRHINSLLACAMGVTDNSNDLMTSIQEREAYEKLLRVELELENCLCDDKNKLIEIHLLHQYNNIKDATQVVINELANIEATTVTEIHKRLNLCD